jgi:agmatine deiminase
MKRALFLALVLSVPAWAVRPDLKRLPIHATPAELAGRAALTPVPASVPPVGPIRSLGEWEDARGAMTGWTNPSLVREMAARGKVFLLADSQADKSWWVSWLSQNGIPSANVSYIVVPTDSLWVRDYGPWPILDGQGHYGLVDNTYNRPRPVDDRFSGLLASQMGIPFFQTGLVHTGGNYYSDGLGNAFSSTLVFTENPKLSGREVLDRMQDFLGIDRYATSPLAPKITIEHLDTFGKLVAPDTWVFSDFPQGSRYRSYSEKMVQLLSALKSPYGTPYKIHRMKMVSGPGVEFRAYLNSFISNGALYYPTYGNDAADLEAKRVYQAALPNYEIVGVSAGGTSWGDSVHCRNRNLIEWKTIFLFPRVEHIASGESEKTEITVDAFASQGAALVGAPELAWALDGVSQPKVSLQSGGGSRYLTELRGLAKGRRVSFHIEAKDSSGLTKRVPQRAEIELVVGG